jgi:hypothetical protein
MFSSYQKQALTVMISPLCTNGHDIINIVECGIKHHQPNPLFTNSNDKQHNDQKIPKDKLNSEMISKIWKISKSNSEKIWKIQKKIAKR